MSIKLSTLKKREIRRKILVTNELGEQETVIIKNPDQEAKDFMVKFLSKRISNTDTELTIDPVDILVNFLPLLTNIEIDAEDVEDIIENPSPQLIEVHYHIGEIVQEIINEMLMQQSANLSLASQHSVIKDIETKVEKLVQEEPKKKRATKKK